MVVRAHGTGKIDNVRMHAYRLTNSKCFDGLDARMSCLACHDPHAHELLPSVKKVDEKCPACHSAGAPVTAVDHVHPKLCPVGTSQCASCHMPKIPLMNGDIAVTDHEIRIVHPGGKYPD